MGISKNITDNPRNEKKSRNFYKIRTNQEVKKKTHRLRARNFDGDGLDFDRRRGNGLRLNVEQLQVVLDGLGNAEVLNRNALLAQNLCFGNHIRRGTPLHYHLLNETRSSVLDLNRGRWGEAIVEMNLCLREIRVLFYLFGFVCKKRFWEEKL